MIVSFSEFFGRRREVRHPGHRWGALAGRRPSGLNACRGVQPGRFRFFACFGSSAGGGGGGGGGSSSGATTPIEMMCLSAASTLIFSGRTLARGIIRKKPEVGFGVVGTYRLTCSLASWSSASATSPPGRPVTKAIVQEPRCGYCTSTASRKALPLLENSVSETCLTEL